MAGDRGHATLVSMTRRLIAALAVLGLLALAGATAGGLLGSRAERAPEGESASTPAVAPHPPQPPTVAHDPPPLAQSRAFRSEARLREHHEKHGREFGRVTVAQYLALARGLRDRPLGPRVLEIRRADGTITRFDRDSGAFLAFEPDGTIRTFFKPRDGEAYFRRQGARTAG